MPELILILISVLLVVACGFFVAAEFSFITVNRTTIDRMAAKGDSKSIGVAHALKTLSTQLSGAQVGITITSLSIGFLAKPAVASLIEGPLRSIGVTESILSATSIVISLILATAITMVFGELVPKYVALARPLATARFVQAPQRLFSQIMKYPIRFLNGTANMLIRSLGITPQEVLASARSADELASLVRRSAEKGTLSKETALMLERSLVFDDLIALDVMTPRVKMRAIQADATIDEILQLTKTTGFSRFPVFNKNLDDIIGTVHVKQTFSVDSSKRQSITVREIMRSPVLAPSSIQLNALFEMLRKGSVQMAIVIDEFGGTDGIVTMEDLLEELVGEVHDEHDHSSVSISKQRGGGWLVSGLLRPDEIGKKIGIFLPEEEVETVGGIIAHNLERVPKLGDSVTITALNRAGQNITVRIKVTLMDKRRIDRAHLTVTKKHSPESAE